MSIKGCRIVLVLCLFFLLFSADVLMAQKIMLKVVTKDAYIRLKGSIDSMIISQISLGTVLEASEKTGDWYKVALPPDEEGFVVEGYIHSMDVEVVVNQDPEIAPVSPIVQKTTTKKPPGEEEEQTYRPARIFPVQFGLKFSGGEDNFLIGDLNDYLEGREQWLKDITDVFDVKGRYEPLQLGIGLAAEFFVDFTPHLGLSVGAGYFQVEKKTNVDLTYNQLTDDKTDLVYDDEWIFPQISAIPITLNLNLGLPLGRSVKIKLSGGIGYYLATVVWDYKRETNFFKNTMSWEAKANTFGYQGSLGLEFKLGQRLFVFVEGFGRMAQLDDLSGDLTISEIWNESETSESYEGAFLKYLEYNSDITDKWYPLVSVDEDGVVGSGVNNVPSFSSVSSMRNAVIDLTGVSLRTGFKIVF